MPAAEDMNEDSTYTYARGDLLEKRNTYTYTSYHGDAFFSDWRKARANVYEKLPPPEQAPIPRSPRHLKLVREDDIYDTAELLESIMVHLLQHEFDEWTSAVLAHLVRRFEVSKRVHTQYLTHWWAAPGSTYTDLVLYIRYAEVMEQAYSVTNRIDCLNVLLKVLDTLSSQVSSLSLQESGRLARLLNREDEHINRLLSAT